MSQKQQMDDLHAAVTADLLARVRSGEPGFSNADASGNWTGIDVAVCRAVAAAVLPNT